MNIYEYIDRLGQKYKYSSELMDALKKCVPVMIEGKDKKDIDLLIDTLERVQIFNFEEQPTQEQIDDILEQKLQGRNRNIKSATEYTSEYGKILSPGAYVNEPIFDDDMNIVDRVGFIYLTNLYPNSKTAQIYGNRINLSHLIHELGHAWAAQRGEFVQEKNGDYTMNVGAAKFKNKVDRDTHTVKELGTEGLYVEEALNSIEEENVLCKILGIESVKDIPEYIPSNYQGAMTRMMRYYIEKFGYDVFKDIRIQKNRQKVDQLQAIFYETDFMKQVTSDEYINLKKSQFDDVQNSSMSDKSKKKIEEFFEQYKDVYFSGQTDQGLLAYLDNVMEQIYDFTSIKYSFDITKPDIFDLYKQIHMAIIKEGYIPVNQACIIMEERKKQAESQERINLVREMNSKEQENIHEGWSIDDDL